MIAVIVRMSKALLKNPGEIACNWRKPSACLGVVENEPLAGCAARGSWREAGVNKRITYFRLALVGFIRIIGSEIEVNTSVSPQGIQGQGLDG